MKNLLLLFLALPAFCLAQPRTSKSPAAPVISVAAAEGFTLRGNIQGLADGEAKIISTQGEEVLAKAPVKNGAFLLKGKLDEPGLYWLEIGSEQRQYIFLENAPIQISGRQNDIKHLKIEGSASHNDFLQFRKEFDPLFAGLNAQAMQIQQAPEEKKPELMPAYTAAIAQMNEAVGQFVAARPTSYVSLFLLTVTRQINENIAEVEQRFQSLSAPLQVSALGKEMAGYLAVAKIGAVGTDALEFTQNDTEGKPVSLSQFRGKYVLVDFWASWCKPCRMENPAVVKAYNRFKDKNFTILGVSLDQSKEAWKKAIRDDQLAWTQVSDLQFWNNAVAQLYHVQSIPRNFLIDPSGKIVARDLRGEELEKKLCDLLGCSN